MKLDFEAVDWDQTCECHKCGKNMVKQADRVYGMVGLRKVNFSWWCKCGASKKGGTSLEVDDLLEKRRRWEKANQPETAADADAPQVKLPQRRPPPVAPKRGPGRPKKEAEPVAAAE